MARRSSKGAAHFSAHDARASRLSRTGQLPWLDVTRGPVAKDLRALFFPTLAGVLLQYATIATHVFFLGRTGMVRPEAIQAIGSLCELVLGFSLAIGVGFPIVISQYFGAHDKKHLFESVHTSIALSLALGALVAVVGIPSVNRVLLLIGTPLEATADVRVFAYAFLGTSVLPLLFNVGCGIQRAVGNVRAFARTSALVCLTTVGLDFVLVANLRLGTCGAACSGVGAYLLGNVLTLLDLMDAPRSWRLYLTRIRPVMPLASTMLVCALPLVLQSTAFMLADQSLLIFVNAFGPKMAEAWEVAQRISSSVTLVTTALTTTIIVFSAQNFGAGTYDRMREGLHVALRLCVLLTGGLGVLVSVSARSIAIVATRDATTIALAATIVLATMPFYVFCACTDCLASTVRGAGEGMRPTLIILLGACALRVAWFALALPMRHTIIAIFLAYPLCGAITLALMIPYYRHGNWLDRSLRRAKLLRSQYVKARAQAR